MCSSENEVQSIFHAVTGNRSCRASVEKEWTHRKMFITVPTRYQKSGGRNLKLWTGKVLCSKKSAALLKRKIYDFTAPTGIRTRVAAVRGRSDGPDYTTGAPKMSTNPPDWRN